TIPPMLKELPGPYALLGWLVAGVLMLFDGLIWSELGAALPGSGGTYLYLLASYGRDRWGRMMAFLFIWQFLISGPLEVASGLIAISIFVNGLGGAFTKFNEAWTRVLPLWPGSNFTLAISPSRLIAFALGVLILVLLRRRITALSRMTVTVWV